MELITKQYSTSCVKCHKIITREANNKPDFIGTICHEGWWKVTYKELPGFEVAFVCGECHVHRL